MQSLNRHKIAQSLLTILILTNTAQASELIYRPNNPSFGGNPLNGSFLLGSAAAQNSFKDPAEELEENSALDDFNDRLQRSLLSRLSASLSSSFVDDNGQLIPGTTETSDFVIDIVDEGNGTLSITTTDKVTGDFTSFTVESNI